jgi:catechol 2,3-dioxygenase-like lactoylglutathione lyase family enzyme
MSVAGPDFVALQVRNLEEAAHFYESRLGLHRAVVSPPGAVVFDTTPIAFAVREPLPGVDLDAPAARPGLGVALEAAGVRILVAPFDSPFGRTFTFSDPDGYAVTVHDALPGGN